jgi:nitroreductase
MTTPFPLSITDRLLSTTRAVRRRLDTSRPVGRDVILSCIALSQQAPTASNAQGWRWVVVDDAKLRAEIGRIYRSLVPMIQTERDERDPDDRQTRRVYDAALWLADHLAEVPVHAIPCIEGRLPEGAPLGYTAAHLGSILPAVWSFQIALRSRGLGSVFTTLHLFKEQEVAELLGIPETVMQVALLPVAWTRGTGFEPAARPGPETITHWNTWQG